MGEQAPLSPEEARDERIRQLERSTRRRVTGVQFPVAVLCLAGALFLLVGAVFPMAVLPLPVQLVGLATPLSWWAISQWLDSFAYRIRISPLTFVAAGVAELLLAVASVAWLSIRAATLNPSQVLREE